MGNFNELAIEDICLMNLATGMEFVIEDGKVTGAYIPEERMKADEHSR
jgi:hypothetical protein